MNVKLLMSSRYPFPQTVTYNFPIFPSLRTQCLSCNISVCCHQSKSIVFLSRVYFCLLMYIVLLCVYCCLTLVAGLLARSQYPEGPATGHLGTAFSWFPCVYKRMLRSFSRLQVPMHASHVALPT